MIPSRDRLIRVARRLGDLNDEVVFVGGCAVYFLVPGFLLKTIRVTADVDCVVQATTTVDYYRVSDRLRAMGFKECLDEGAPLCRWVIDEIIVDVMPTGEAALGFRNRWYDWVLAEPLEVAVADLRIKVVNAPTFLATKFEAFADRGQGDYIGDTDFEDIVVVMAYREEIVDLIRNAPEPVRTYLISRAKELLEMTNLSDLVSGCLPSDHVSQSYVPSVLAALGNIAQLTSRM